MRDIRKMGRHGLGENIAVLTGASSGMPVDTLGTQRLFKHPGGQCAPSIQLRLSHDRTLLSFNTPDAGSTLWIRSPVLLPRGSYGKC